MLRQFAAIDREHLRARIDEEKRRFVDAHPRSKAAFERARASMLGGVPMNWMDRWVGGFPVVLEHAEGARATDIDGHAYVDFCVGDTGAMAGHSPAATVAAVREQVARGITAMLPSEDGIWVAEELGRRFGIPKWQFTLTATDANRFTIRLARGITGRPKILVFNYCYHGSVDETFVVLKDGKVVARDRNVGPPVDLAVTTRVVEWNDVDGLERELSFGDVACVLAEPALTNIGMVLPEPGYHDALRELTRRTGTLLVIDETHTMSSGPGGYTAAHHLQPDFLTVGKALAGGIPWGAYGMTDEVAARVAAADIDDTGGIGGTLAANVLSMAAARATLSEVLTEEAYARMIGLAERYAAGVQDVIDSNRMPWHIIRLGARAEYGFSAVPPRNGGEAAAAMDHELDEYAHLNALNRGILLTPFHNMALMSPATTQGDIDAHTEVFAEGVRRLLA
ncbi:MAG TPA: aspartate aminotransferase family protein [Candidatus Dormibacteraeota bacterium]|nr:aspartate aminotransferase family protein [Candidatus Dormibacteraeota bacterium]